MTKPIPFATTPLTAKKKMELALADGVIVETSMTLDEPNQTQLLQERMVLE